MLSLAFPMVFFGCPIWLSYGFPGTVPTVLLAFPCYFLLFLRFSYAFLKVFLICPMVFLVRPWVCV